MLISCNIQKSFIPKKILSVPCTMYIPWIALFSANTWRLDVLTFLIKGFAKDCIIFLNPLWTASWKYFTKLLYENTKAKAQLYIRFYWPTESDLTLNSLTASPRDTWPPCAWALEIHGLELVPKHLRYFLEGCTANIYI